MQITAMKINSIYNLIEIHFSDDRVFVFRKDPTRTATKEEISAFEQKLSSSNIQTKKLEI
jgi:hypothetical protein